MRILFAFDHVFYRDPGGIVYSPGQFPYLLWERYLQTFENVVVASRMRQIPDGSDTSMLNVSSGPNVSFVSMPDLCGIKAALTARRKAMEILKGALFRVDALIARLPSEIGALAIKTAMMLGKPWSVEVVACTRDILWNHGSWRGKVYALVAACRTRNLVRQAPYVLYVTDEFLQKRYPSIGKSIGCSDVAIEEIDEDILRARLALIEKAQPPFKIGFIGSLGPKYKGLDTALYALQEIHRQIPNFELRILGGGNQEPWQRIAQRLGLSATIKFYGTLPSGREVQSWLDEINLYIQPSRTEGLPRALLEAMSRACPSLGTRVGGIPELLDESCMFEAGDHVRLAELITRAAGDKKWQCEMAVRNFRKSMGYTAKILNSRRTEFWQDFAQSFAR